MKLSFIIPAYNVERYLERCLLSILEQPFRDYEIIVINDGSTDRTEEIARHYALRDPRIRIINQPNSGQGAARLNGIDQAQGEYVWCVDSDDCLVDNVLLRMARILEQFAPEVLVANFEYFWDGGAVQPASVVPPRLVGKVIEPAADPADFAVVSCWTAPPWRLIARRQLLIDKGIRFATGVFYEDHPFAIKLMLNAKRVYVDGGITYRYYQREGSTTKLNDRKAFDFIPVRDECLKLFAEYGAREDFAGILVGYIAPFNFYEAHVADEFKGEFLTRLAAKLSDDDVEFVRLHGDWSAQAFLKMVRAGDPKLMRRLRMARRLRAFASRDGYRRIVAHGRAAARRFVGKAIASGRQAVSRQIHHAGYDYGGVRYVELGQGARLEHAIVDVRVKPEHRKYLRVGDGTHVGGYYVFERGLGTITIGDKSSIGSGCKMICSQEEGIVIGNNVMISWDCTLIDSDSHSLDPAVRWNDAYDWKCSVDVGQMGAYKDWSQVVSKPIVIEDGAWIGFESVIMKGVRIGRGAVVAARSVVTKDVAPFSVYGGNPARFIKLVPRESWSWEDIVGASQGDPQFRDILDSSYLSADTGASLRRFRESGEFVGTLELIRAKCPHARTMIDVGGGNGVMAVAFALEGYHVKLVEKSGDRIVGTLAAETLLNFVARNVDPTIRERVRIVSSDMESLDVDEQFDVVYCRQALHHFRDPVTSLKKIKELLAANGVALLIREHVIFDEDDRARFLDGHAFHHYYGGENAYTVEQYLDFVKAAGLRLRRTLGFADSVINYFPHSEQELANLSELDVAGRPYSFVLDREEAAQ
ncbi:glycosyltransferase [Burkholderia sp. Se-20378]|uniref:glycosyltransferase n=1 Tax=Burkholderia sp. Se-20378 TaxID=2703899 RepID=UPI00197FBE81|nr:glycosyltransferase [Burkholderia sp. Se-20378]MBN3769185.1 glycosyltransferase [Burkholderia sp. Se-20378]